MAEALVCLILATASVTKSESHNCEKIFQELSNVSFFGVTLCKYSYYYSNVFSDCMAN